MGRYIGIRQECPLAIVKGEVIENWSPLCILLLGRQAYLIVDVQRIHDIGIIDDVAANSCPATFLGGVQPRNVFSRRPWFKNNDLFSADGTDGIHKVLHADHRCSADCAASMLPA